jgi:hypothetical protein
VERELVLVRLGPNQADRALAGGRNTRGTVQLCTVGASVRAYTGKSLLFRTPPKAVDRALVTAGGTGRIDADGDHIPPAVSLAIPSSSAWTSVKTRHCCWSTLEEGRVYAAVDQDRSRQNQG